MHTVSGEVSADAGKGVCITRTAERKPQSARWSADVVESMGGVPWHPSEKDDDTGGPNVKVQLGERVGDECAEKER